MGYFTDDERRANDAVYLRGVKATPSQAAADILRSVGTQVPEYYADTPPAWEQALNGGEPNRVVDRDRLSALLADPSWDGAQFGNQDVTRQRAQELVSDPSWDSFEYGPRTPDPSGAPAPGPSSPSLQAGGSAPAAPAAPYEPTTAVPKDPYTQQLAPLPKAPGSVEAADAQVRAGYDQLAQLSRQATDDRYADEKAQAERLAGVDARALQETEAAERARQQAHQLAAQAADQETKDWLKRQEEAAKAEPDSSRYFNNQSAFGKIAWLVGLAASSAAAGADQSKNVVLKMIRETVDQDMRSQESAIGRKMDVLRAEGSAMDKRHQRAFQEVESAAAGRFQRLQAIRNYLTTQAKIPGSEARQAGLSAMDAQLAQVQLKTIEDYRTQRVQERAAEVERNFRAEEARKADGRQAWREKQERTWRADEAQKGRNFDRDEKQKDRDLDRDLATISASSKGGADLDPYGTPKDWDYFDEGSGVLVSAPDGKGGTEKKGLLVRKGENAAAVQKVVDSAADELVALAKVRAAYEKSDWTDRALNSDPVLMGAITELARARAKSLNSGALTDKDAEAGYISAVGLDITSALSKLKGAGPEEIQKYLDQQIQDHAGRWNVKVRSAAKVRMPPGATLQFRLPKELERRDAPSPTH